MKRLLIPLLGLSLAACPLNLQYPREASAQEGCINFPYKKMSKNPNHFRLDIKVVGRPDYESQMKIPAESTDSQRLEICGLKPKEIYKIHVSECTYRDRIEECALPDTMFVGFAKGK